MSPAICTGLSIAGSVSPCIRADDVASRECYPVQSVLASVAPIAMRPSSRWSIRRLAARGCSHSCQMGLGETRRTIPVQSRVALLKQPPHPPAGWPSERAVLNERLLRTCTQRRYMQQRLWRWNPRPCQCTLVAPAFVGWGLHTGTGCAGKSIAPACGYSPVLATAAHAATFAPRALHTTSSRSCF